MSRRSVGATDQDLDQLTSLFRLLSDKTRLNILFLLSEGEKNVTSLCEELKLPQPTVSHHLGLLRMSNVIGNRRHGKQVFYSLNGRVDANGEVVEDHLGHVVAQLVDRLFLRLGGQHVQIGDAQTEFLKARDACRHDVPCLTKAYRTRIGQLNQVIAAIASRGPY